MRMRMRACKTSAASRRAWQRFGPLAHCQSSFGLWPVRASETVGTHIRTHACIACPWLHGCRNVARARANAPAPAPVSGCGAINAIQSCHVGNRNQVQVQAGLQGGAARRRRLKPRRRWNWANSRLKLTQYPPRPQYPVPSTQYSILSQASRTAPRRKLEPANTEVRTDVCAWVQRNRSAASQSVSQSARPGRDSSDTYATPSERCVSRSHATRDSRRETRYSSSMRLGT